MSQRFSDAELAAEYWAIEAEMAYSESCISGAAFDRLYDMQEAFHRFATLPHAHDPEPKTVYVYDASGRCIGNFPKPDSWPE